LEETTITVIKKRDTDRARVNERIRATQVRLIDSKGEQVGVVPVMRALEIAREEALDLVEISPNSDPPVCRIMDYGKFVFEQNKKTAAARKKQKQIQVKEIKFRPTTGEGDFQVKLRNAIRFLEEGDKVKITVRFRGREIEYQELGTKLMQRLETDLHDIAVVEQEARSEGRQLTMILSPKKQTKK